MNDTIRIAQALDFAARAHVDQRRKGKRGEPYVNHLTEVARLVAEATEGKDANLVIAALLHDAIEDTGTTHAQLVDAFGADVADLVQEVTDDKNLSKQERKRLQVETAPKKSNRAKVLKIADKVANLRALVASPPASWPRERIEQYFDWAGQVVAGCRGVNAWLEAQFDEAAHALDAPPIERLRQSIGKGI